MKKHLNSYNIFMGVEKFFYLADQLIIESKLKIKRPEFLENLEIKEFHEFYKYGLYKMYGSLNEDFIRTKGGNMIGFLLDFFEMKIKKKAQNIYENSEKMYISLNTKLVMLLSVKLICLLLYYFSMTQLS